MAILVGFTGTHGGEDALSLGALIARTINTSIDVLIVLPQEHAPTFAQPNTGFDDLVRQQARQWLENAEETIPSTLEIRTHIRYADSPSTGLVDACEEFTPDCLVIGGGRHGALGRLSLGSIGQNLLYSCSYPVALAPRGMRHRRMQSITRVTAGVGNLPGNARLLKESLALADRAQADLRLVSLLTLAHPESGEQAEERAARNHAQEVLNFASERLSSHHHITAEIAEGKTIDEAAEGLQWLPDEVVLLGSSCLAAPNRIFLGSVANKILRVLPVPLIVVPRSEVSEE